MQATKRKVTVVIPTYKRAHLLAETIPTYLQPDVEELILVDDCSPDDTTAVAQKLMQTYPRISYLRNETNSKQTVSKNRGKTLAETDYIYFGDDDSILSDGGIAMLLESAEKSGCEIVGASALYLRNDADTLRSILARRKQVDNADAIVNLSELHFDCSTTTRAPIELPVCQASFLIRTEAARSVDFDTGYVGNCYREETDYLIRCRALGYRIIYDSRVTQINLPPSKATGGARGRGRLSYEGYALYNTVRFILKNQSILTQLDHRCRSGAMISRYIMGRIRSAMARFKAPAQ
ncbi:glycosyltransferase [Cupriavidus necator]|uniref:glycosyltransferase family 2 protein n=1 Tax=Cupriavidus necator TaxID=106590 RepID=UPI00148F4A22|nr:glycosyltransferase [Cupriavidus necator]NOV25079.1 glycosyltransferase [Cupriavidus necator]